MRFTELRRHPGLHNGRGTSPLLCSVQVRMVSEVTTDGPQAESAVSDEPLGPSYVETAAASLARHRTTKPLM